MFQLLILKASRNILTEPPQVMPISLLKLQLTNLVTPVDFFRTALPSFSTQDSAPDSAPDSGAASASTSFSRSAASVIARASTFPPPTLPKYKPFSVTSILLPTSCGTLPLESTTVTITNGVLVVRRSFIFSKKVITVLKILDHAN